MTAPTDRRLALDILQLMTWWGRGHAASCRRLRADDGLRRWLEAIGPADDGINDAYAAAWDGLRLHIRRESHRLRVMEAEAVRRLIPQWREQGRLLAAVEVAAERERRAEAEDGSIDSAVLGDDEAWVGPDDAADLDDITGFGGGP